VTPVSLAFRDHVRSGTQDMRPVSATLVAKTQSPGAVGPARGMTIAFRGGNRMDDSSSTPGRKNAYDALIKPGDAITTPDEALWVVEKIEGLDLGVISAYRDSTGQICADVYEPTRTVIPKELAYKVADARQVRR
jgi:hypothetical protein